MTLNDPVIDSIKNKLDIFSELLYNYYFLSRALFAVHLDRQMCYDVFKGFMDIVRFNEVACSENLDLKTRQDTAACSSDDRDARLKSSILQLSRWREENFSLSDSDLCAARIRNAYSVAFGVLGALSESIVSEVSKLDRTPQLFEVESLKDEANNNLLHPVTMEPKWSIVAEEILQRCSPEVTGVWLSYFYFFIITSNLAGSHLQKITNAASSIFKKYKLASPDNYGFPVIITEHMFKALLCSCYTTNPYLYYDCLYDDSHCICTYNMNDVTEAPHVVVFNMVREAISVQAVSTRQDYVVMFNSHRLYRGILKLLRLKLCISLGKIVVPHERVFDYYKYCFPEDSDWIGLLKYRSERSPNAWRWNNENPLMDYYPKMRSLIDSMSWVFDSALIPERLCRDRR